MTQYGSRTVGSVMPQGHGVVDEHATLVAAAARRHRRCIGSVVMSSSQGGDVAGMITETDVARNVITQRLAPSATPVARVLARPLLTITPERPLLDVRHLMALNHVRPRGVAGSVQIIGLLSGRDRARQCCGCRDRTDPRP